jgi:glycosyltransferase involved in cell wall biosynthesis
MISVLIPTKNEEKSLPGCLDSVAWSDDVHVYDSGSSDATVEIARMRNAQVSVRSSGSGSSIFGGNEAAHRTWALENIKFKYKWVLHIDADERVTQELQRGVCGAAQNPGPYVAFKVKRRDFFLDSWLRYVQTTPVYIRLFRPEKIRYERLINPATIPVGPVGEIEGYLDHFPFNKGMRHWLDRHNHYSTLEAEQIVANRAAQGGFSLEKAFFAKDLTERRFHQKELFYKLPARPLAKFLLLYVAKRGFLDGQAGFTYAVLQSFYEYMIVLKTRELLAAPR